MIEWNDFIGQLFTVAAKGGLPQQLPLPRGGFCSFSPDGKKLAYNRIFREFRTWKRYRGGMADDIWIYDFETKKTENISSNPACDVFPMWAGDKIYFLSDRDSNERFNLFSLRRRQPRRPSSSPSSPTSTSSSHRSATRRSSSRTAAISTASIWPPRRRSRCRSASSRISSAAATS